MFDYWSKSPTNRTAHDYLRSSADSLRRGAQAGRAVQALFNALSPEAVSEKGIERVAKLQVEGETACCEMDIAAALIESLLAPKAS